MNYLWDFDRKELEKTESGKALILERMINYGRNRGDIIRRQDVLKYWDQMNLFPQQKQLFEMTLWDKLTR